MDNLFNAVDYPNLSIEWLPGGISLAWSVAVGGTDAVTLIVNNRVNTRLSNHHVALAFAADLHEYRCQKLLLPFTRFQGNDINTVAQKTIHFSAGMGHQIKQSPRQSFKAQSRL